LRFVYHKYNRSKRTNLMQLYKIIYCRRGDGCTCFGRMCPSSGATSVKPAAYGTLRCLLWEGWRGQQWCETCRCRVSQSSTDSKINSIINFLIQLFQVGSFTPKVSSTLGRYPIAHFNRYFHKHEPNKRSTVTRITFGLLKLLSESGFILCHFFINLGN
jgi:hypothetical protein